MATHRSATAAFGAAVVAATFALVASGQGPTPLPLAPMGNIGVALSPAQEGWWTNADGTHTFLLGHFNRNAAALDIPVGPNNRFEPDSPDMGQPTHFLPGRHRGVFSITVPKDFGKKKLTWTVIAHGQTQSITLWLNQPYVLDPFRNASNGNTPPKVRFDPKGPELTATPSGIAQTLEAAVAKPLTLTFWTTDAGNTIELNPFAEAASGSGRSGGRGRAGGAAPDDAGAGPTGSGGARGRGGDSAPIRVTWSKFRGAGEVKFDPVSPSVEEEGRTTATATFSQPGEYVLRAQVNDASGEGGGGDGCCWTNVNVKVNVR